MKILKASELISSLEEACRRPLFVEIVLREEKEAAFLQSRKTTPRPSSTGDALHTVGRETDTVSFSLSIHLVRKRSRTDEKKDPKTWEQVCRVRVVIVCTCVVSLLPFVLTFLTIMT